MGNDPRNDKVFTAADLQEAIKATAKSMAEEMAASMMASQMAAAQMGKPVVAKRPSAQLCEICRQSVTACGGVPKIEGERTPDKIQAAYNKNHAKMCVFPTRYPEFGEHFRGCGLNGIWYLSNRPGHEIWVPRENLGQFASIIEAHENNERSTRLGRTKERHSGSVNNPNTIPESGVGGWR